jgi:hypothetical protein
MFLNRKSLSLLTNILIFSGILLGSLFEVAFSVLVGCVVGCVLNLIFWVNPKFLGCKLSDKHLDMYDRIELSEKNKVMEDLDREVSRRRESVKFNRN